MKSVIVIVIALFVITDKTSQGQRFPFRKRRYVCTGQTPNSVVADGNRTYIYLENTTLIKGTYRSDPTVVKKKFSCICKLPACVCCKFGNPESWYVKTFLKGDTRIKPALYSITHTNLTEEILNREKELEKAENDTKMREEAKKNLKYKLCPMKKEPEYGNKWLFGCPPLINLSWKKHYDSQSHPKKYFTVQCECLRCKLYSPTDKSGVLLKCVKCGPIYVNERSEKINFSKLLFEKNNKSRIRAKFIQVNHNKK